jgi:hypothetical protein
MGLTKGYRDGEKKYAVVAWKKGVGVRLGGGEKDLTRTCKHAMTA